MQIRFAVLLARAADSRAYHFIEVCSKSNSDVLLKLPYLTLSPLCVPINFVKNPAFYLHYHDRTHKNKQYDIEAWACRFSQTHHTLLIFNYKLTWIIYPRYSKINTSQPDVHVNPPKNNYWKKRDRVTPTNAVVSPWGVQANLIEAVVTCIENRRPLIITATKKYTSYYNCETN